MKRFFIIVGCLILSFVAMASFAHSTRLGGCPSSTFGWFSLYDCQTMSPEETAERILELSNEY